MRKKYKEQLPLMEHTIDHPHAVEMKLIDKILKKTSIIYKLALQDLTREVKNQETGANGMAAFPLNRGLSISYPLDTFSAFWLTLALNLLLVSSACGGRIYHAACTKELKLPYFLFARQSRRKQRRIRSLFSLLPFSIA